MIAPIALLSHRGGNVGHDLMAAGMAEAVKEAFGDDIKIVHFEQHRPFEVYQPGHWVRIVNNLPHGRFGFVRRYIARDRVRERLWRDLPKMPYALAIACGGPNLVPGAAKVPEMHLLLHHMNGAFTRSGVPLIDAGVGAAFPIEQPPFRFKNPDDHAFYAQALSYVTRITVRDKVAQAICADLGVEAPLIPCGAIGTGRVFDRLPHRTKGSGHIAINFQARGANTDWGQNVDETRWRTTVRQAIDDLSRRHSIRLLAHNLHEARLAAKLAPELPCDWPKDVASYGHMIAGAKVGFVSRIHAAIPLAGAGVPSLVVGNDTRLGTIETIGLPVLTTKTATAAAIVAGVEDLIAKVESERDRLLTLREDTMRAYASIFRALAK